MHEGFLNVGVEEGSYTPALMASNTAEGLQSHEATQDENHIA